MTKFLKRRELFVLFINFVCFFYSCIFERTHFKLAFLMYIYIYLFIYLFILVFYISFFSSSKLFCECYSFEGFLRLLLVYQQFHYQLNHQLLLSFWIACFGAAFIVSVVDLLALSPRFDCIYFWNFLQKTKIIIFLHAFLVQLNNAFL